jgi:hypothetical protein
MTYVTSLPPRTGHRPVPVDLSSIPSEGQPTQPGSAATGWGIGPEHIGGRVSIRYRRDDGRPAEAIGRLVDWRAGRLRIERRDGSVLEITETQLVAGRPVPDSPPRPANRS